MPRRPALTERKRARKPTGLRTRALEDDERVSFTFDGKPVEGVAGEPIAAALVASRYLQLARSPKFHRARGPSCFRGACDGCLARVDGIPNVMTCRAPVRAGSVVESQNTLGGRELDLLRMTDWLFPEGMNHHLLFAGVPIIQPLMQAFARRVAGLGTLPDPVAPVAHLAHVGGAVDSTDAAAVLATALPPARRRPVDVLVVGAGPAGMSAALAFADADRSVELVDDALEVGGGITALGPLAASWERTRRVFDEAVRRGIIRLRLRTTAAAFFGRDVLVVTDMDSSHLRAPNAAAATSGTGATDVSVAGAAVPSDLGAEVLEPRTVVLATGAHDGVLPFEGNDLPGVMSARAGGWLLERGVVPGKRVVVCVVAGGGPFGDAFVERVKIEGLDCDVRRIEGVPVRAGGVSRLKEIEVQVEARADKRLRGVALDSEPSQRDVTARAKPGRLARKTFAADVLLVDAPRAPSYELCAQAGAALVHTPAGFVVQTTGGRVAPGIYALGEVTGAPLDETEYRAAARRIARAAESDRAPAHSSTSAPNKVKPPASARKSKAASKIR